jgi:hypothetical protein
MMKKGQSTLEFALVFILAGFLILGLIGLWNWSKNNIPARWGAFEGSRVAAGTKASAGEPEVPYWAPSPADPKYLSR